MEAIPGNTKRFFTFCRKCHQWFRSKYLSVNGKIFLMNYNQLSVISLFYHGNTEKKTISAL